MRKFFDWIVTIAGLAAIAVFIVWLEKENSQSWSGRVKVIDGDSLELRGERFRLKGIDAPEFAQMCEMNGKSWPCGRRSRDALRKLARSGTVACKSGEIDQYGRWLATCRAGERDINKAMVEQGWAVSYGSYAVQERIAKTQKRGVWRGHFERPDAWRRAHRGDAVASNAGSGSDGTEMTADTEPAPWYRQITNRIRVAVMRGLNGIKFFENRNKDMN